MTYGRGFQAAARCAGLLRSAGRSGGYMAFESVTRSAVRITGVCSPTAWTAQASQAQQRFAAAQPTYGFAAQGIQNAVDSGASSTETGTVTGCSSGAVAAAGEDGECLPSGDSEGVLPRNKKELIRAPPWAPSVASSFSRQLTSPSGHKLQQPQLPSYTAGALHSGSSCTGVLRPQAHAQQRYQLASPAAQPAAARLFGTQASAAVRGKGSGRRAARDDDSDVDEELPEAVPTFRHPSRPGHSVPSPHRGTQPAGSDAAAAMKGSGVGHKEAAAAAKQEEGHLSAAEYRERHGIQVDDPACPDPYQTFEDAPFPPTVMRVLEEARYGAPSAIQAQAWPIALAGRDLVAIASTGSGKTLGYLLPALLQIQARGGDPALGPSALVLAPTRELARQIEDEAMRFSRVLMGAGAADQDHHDMHGRRGSGSRRGEAAGTPLRTVCLYGGAARGNQLAAMRRRPHLIIATPGRLLDFVESGEINIGQVSFLVLDEADRMLDMGFEPQIASIARNLPPGRQTLFFSATWPTSVREAAAQFASQRPVHVFIGDVQAKPVAATTIKQRVQIVEGREKLQALEAYLRTQLLESESEEGKQQQRRRGGDRRGGERDEEPGRRAIVFCRTKAGCDHLAFEINSTMPFQAASLHGDKSQAAREYALQKFRSGKVPVLVATDVAARGLDIPHVTAVVNYEMPDEIEMYVHRIGRTGRAGASGDSLALITPRDTFIARPLVSVLEGAGQEVPEALHELAAEAARSKKVGQSRNKPATGMWKRSWGNVEVLMREHGRSSRGRDEWDDEEREHSRPRHHHADNWRHGGGREGGGREGRGREGAGRGSYRRSQSGGREDEW
ncbi:hypothetical protein Agub_g8722 [Astrephomene gubernaculifera]|uniref:RNA helicase n=1 Tax=Astrephomene gubernaculifera TaxID=47775 RepID=A0AAD3DUS7_9CHLO|nr:hypothetical protein Agub_g8722 [Astrephomene gubernaculifera]